MNKKLILLVLIFGVITIFISIFILATYHIANAVYFNNDSSTTVTVNTPVIANCIIGTGSTTHTGSGTLATFMRFNTSTIPFRNVSISAYYVTVNSSVQDSTTLPNSAINTSVVAHTIQFNQTGIFWMQCFAPPQTGDGSINVTNGTVMYNVTAATNCWVNTNRMIYVPAGCTYYIPGGTIGYTG